MLEKIRRYISTHLVENNRVLVSEMQRHNNVYGRAKRIGGRGKLVASLFWKYTILRRNPVDSRLKKRERLPLLESSSSNKFNEDKFWELIESVEEVIFDFWNMLFYMSLQKEQLLAIFEVSVRHPGIAEQIKWSKKIPLKYEGDWERIITDFILKDEHFITVLKEVEKRGKKINIRNNSDEYPETVVKSILKANCLEKYLCKEDKNILVPTLDISAFRGIGYKNVNLCGDVYRPFVQENVITQLYNQVVNLKLHGQRQSYSLFYEYGFVYGGILACGFCQFLNELAKLRRIEKFIFVARDGDILIKVYQNYFRTVESSYLVFSRLASYELIFEDFPEEYLDKNIKARIHRRDTDNSIIQVLNECGIEPFKERLIKEGINISDQLTEKNYPLIKECFLKYKDEVQIFFQESCDAAKQYFLNEVKNCHRVCVVDVGWHGKSTIYIKHLLEEKYGWDGSVIGVQLGGASEAVTQQYIQSGWISAFAFDNAYWRRTGRKNGEYMEDEEIVCIEALFSSEQRTLLRYRFNEKGEVDFIYGKENRNAERIRDAHKGIIEFCSQFVFFLKKYQLRINARDAYTPLDSLLQNRQFVDRIFYEYNEEKGAIHTW